MTSDVNTPAADVDAETVLACENLVVTYKQGPDQVQVLNGLNLNVRRGEKLAIVGASGSGKTTLLNMLGGLDSPSSGLVRIQGQDITPLKESSRAKRRNKHLGFVYQFHHLLAEFTAFENVAMPLLIGGASAGEARKAAKAMLARVGLEHRLKHKPAALSGGERQRVAIARALVTEPDCVLMDEPTGNLDPATGSTVLELLLELNRSLAISFVIVTHDHAIARQMDRVMLLSHGVLEAGEAVV